MGPSGRASHTDIVNGATVQTKIADLANIQTQGQATAAGIAVVGQFRQAAINQAIGQIQADEQFRFAINQFINQTESSFLGALLPAILQAQQALTPQVGAPLAVNQSVTYSGTSTATSTQAGATLVSTTTTTVTVMVLPGLAFGGPLISGPASAHVVTTLAATGQVVSDETSTQGYIAGGLASNNNTAISGSFNFVFPTIVAVTTPFTGLIGSSLFIGKFPCGEQRDGSFTLSDV